MKKHILLVFICLIFLACASMIDNWKKTEQLNTIDAYNSFLEKYPESRYSIDAKNKIENRAWL